MNLSPLGFYYASPFLGDYMYLKTFTKDINPSIIQQHQAFVEFFLNNSDPVIKGVTGGEEKKALDAFNYTVHVVKF